jgi:hypothetical protein
MDTTTNLTRGSLVSNQRKCQQRNLTERLWPTNLARIGLRGLVVVISVTESMTDQKEV